MSTRIVILAAFVLLTVGCPAHDLEPDSDAGSRPTMPIEDEDTPDDGDDDYHDPSSDEDRDAATPDQADAGLDAGLLEGLLTCSPQQFNGLVDCLTMTCADDAGSIDFGCAFSTCGSFGSALASPGCIDCVMAAVAMDTDALAEKCVKDGALGDASLPDLGGLLGGI